MKNKYFWNQLYLRYKLNALRKGYSFTLNMKMFVNLCSKNCYYCGSVPEKNFSIYTKIKNMYSKKEHKFNKKKMKKMYIVNFNGIDRKNNNKGYIMSNSITCCKNCNSMKSDLSLKNFKRQIKKIHKHLKLGE